MSRVSTKRTILYTPEQVGAMLQVTQAGQELDAARERVAVATVEAKRATERALSLGIHYKELQGLPYSFTYRVLREMMG
jgi:hypothetical protein